jgi:hypothetical protein
LLRRSVAAGTAESPIFLGSVATFSLFYFLYKLYHPQAVFCDPFWLHRLVACFFHLEAIITKAKAGFQQYKENGQSKDIGRPTFAFDNPIVHNIHPVLPFVGMEMQKDEGYTTNMDTERVHTLLA